MNLLLKIAFFNLWRRKSRSVLVILMIAISITGLLLIQGVYVGMINQLVDNSLRSDSGHISIYHQNYRLSKSLSDQITAPQEVADFLQAQDAVKSLIMRTRHEGLIATAKHSQGALFIGTNLENENRHANLESYLIEGTYDFGDKNNGALIGAQLAKKLDVQVGKKIILTVQNTHREINSVTLRVSGIVRVNNIEMDKSAVLIDQARLQKLLGTQATQTQISLFVKERPMQEVLHARIDSYLQTNHPTLKAYLWKDLFPMFDMIEEMQLVFFLFSYGLIFVIATIGIFGVILVSVLERVREFGIMLAIGSTFGRVRWQIIAESFFLGLIGLGIGSILGGGLLYYFSTVGIDLRAYTEAVAQFGMDAIILAEFEWHYFVSSAIAVTLATFFAALWPIRVLKKLNPIEAVNQN